MPILSSDRLFSNLRLKPLRTSSAPFFWATDLRWFLIPEF